MKIKYLGTAAAEGWPALFCNCDACKKARQKGGKNIRTRSQAIIDDTLLIDFPPDSYMHMLQHAVDLPNLQTLLVTHSHQDHFYPLDLTLRSKYFAHDINNQLQVYGNNLVGEALIKARDYIGGDMGENIEVAYHEIQPFIPFEVQGYTVTPLLAKHKPTERCYIYMIEKENKRLLYAHDTGLFPDETWHYIQGKHFDLVSMDCTLLKLSDGNNHMGIEDNINLCNTLKKSGCIDDTTQLVIAHFSHGGALLHEEIEKRVASENFKVAFDGLEIQLEDTNIV